MTSNRIPVEINGMRFTVIGDGQESYIQMIAHLVESRINAIKEKNPGLSNLQALTLTAFNLADEGYRKDGDSDRAGESAVEQRWMAMTDELKEKIDELNDIIADKNKQLKNHAIEIEDLKKQIEGMEELKTIKHRNEQLLRRQLEEADKYQRLKREFDGLQLAYQRLESEQFSPLSGNDEDI